MPIEIRFEAAATDQFLALTDPAKEILVAHLQVFAADWRTVTRRMYPPAGVGFRTGIWLRHPAQNAHLLEMRFRWYLDATVAVIYRIDFNPHDRVPAWVINPFEWYDDQPSYPLIDVVWQRLISK